MVTKGQIIRDIYLRRAGKNCLWYGGGIPELRKAIYLESKPLSWSKNQSPMGRIDGHT